MPATAQTGPAQQDRARLRERLDRRHGAPDRVGERHKVRAFLDERRDILERGGVTADAGRLEDFRPPGDPLDRLVGGRRETVAPRLAKH